MVHYRIEAEPGEVGCKTDDDALRAFDEGVARQEREVATKLTPEFLATLVLAARAVGHDCDYSEIREFVELVYDLARQKRPTIAALEPFDPCDGLTPRERVERKRHD